MKITRDDKEMVIRKLVEQYPKCFFEEPRQRLPLKKNITADLEKDGFHLARELIIAGIDWYQSHFSYKYALEVGAKRIDLNGKAAGTVTAKERDEALAEIADIKQKQKDAIQTVSVLHAAGRITDDQLRKLDASPMKTKSPPPAPSLIPAPSSKLTKLYEALEAASDALNAPNAGALQAALAGAALGVLIEEAKRVRDDITAT